MRGGRERAQRNLYVLNLPLDATTDQFEALFGQFGSVEHAVILATLDHLARRRGFILMADPAQARAAIQHLNGHEWHHYRIEVSFAIVQRSGTPFCNDGVESRTDDERPTQMSAADTVNQQKWTLERGHGLAELQASQNADKTTLLLSGLDTSVVTSATMVRALTEPFGHIVELRQYRQHEDTIDRGRASIEYCCSSSASLARLSLHGMVVGAGKVQATLVQTRSSFALGAHDGQSDSAAASIPSLAASTSQLRLECIEHLASWQTREADAERRPRQSDATTARGDPGLQARESRGPDARLDTWRDSHFCDPTVAQYDNEDPILVDRRHRPRPIGDERHR